MVTLKQIKDHLIAHQYPSFWHITNNDKQIQIHINDSVVFFLQPDQKTVKLTDGGWNLMTLPPKKRNHALNILQNANIDVTHQIITMHAPLDQINLMINQLIQVFETIGYDDLKQANPKVVNQWFGRLENAVDNLDLADDLSLESINQLTNHQKYRAQSLIDNLKTFINTIEGDLKSR